MDGCDVEPEGVFDVDCVEVVGRDVRGEEDVAWGFGRAHVEEGDAEDV